METRTPNNDNRKRQAGWPAMARARAGKLFPSANMNAAAAALMAGFGELWERATSDGMESNWMRISIDDVWAAQEVEADQQEGMPEGFRHDRTLEMVSPERLVRLYHEGRVRVTLAHDAEHTLFVCGKRTGNWFPVEERWRRAKAPVSGVMPAATRPASVDIDDRIDAQRRLADLRAELGAPIFDELRQIVVEKVTAKTLGERHGKKHKPAEAYGGERMKVCLSEVMPVFFNFLPSQANMNRRNRSRLAA